MGGWRGGMKGGDGKGGFAVGMSNQEGEGCVCSVHVSPAGGGVKG